MVREESKKFLPIIQAFAEGKTIETYSYSEMNWVKANNHSFSCCYEYRVKPEFRPFKDRDECWKNMLYHKPFGWVIEKENKEHFNINSIGETCVGCYTYR